MSSELVVQVAQRSMTPEPIGAEARRQSTGRRRRRQVPDEHRKRVRIACKGCRKNKLRCNGGDPCERCIGTGRPCQYFVDATGVDERARSIRPPPTAIEQQDEQLRLLRQIFAKDHPGTATDFDSLRRYHSQVLGDQPGRRDASGSPQSDRGTDDTDSGHRADEAVDGETTYQHQYGDENFVYDGAHNHTASVTVVNQGKTHFEGTSSLWSFFSSVRQVFAGDIDDDDENEEADCGGTTVHQVSSVSFGTDWRTAVQTALPPREVVKFLTTTFFNSAQSNYFCIHPEIFSRKLTAFYDGTHEFEAQAPGSPSSRRPIEFMAVFFMVLAIGSQFAEVGVGKELQSTDHQEALMGDLASSHDLVRLKIPIPEKNPGWRFYEVSRKLLPDVICSSSMASVQVCALQGIYLPSTTSRDAGYNLIGLALRMAINMGLHRSFTASSLHAHVRELRNRLWWSVYVAERLYGVEMGRPLSLSDSEIDTPFPTEMPEWNDCIGGPTNIDGLIGMTRLCQLLGRIVEEVYCKPSSTEKGAIIRPKAVQKLHHDLGEWKKSLPRKLNFANPKTRTVAHLALTYEQATILLTRSCLNYAVGISESDSPVGSGAARFIRQQAQQCVNSAVSSIRILSQLRSQSLLCHFSFHDSLYCSSALHVLFLAERKLPNIISAPKASIHKGIVILLDLARGSEAAASSLRSIIRAMAKSPARPDRQHTDDIVPSQSDEMNVRERGRDAWRAWMMAQPSCEPQLQHAGDETAAESDLLGSRMQDNGSTWRSFNTQYGREHEARQRDGARTGAMPASSAPPSYNQHVDMLPGMAEDEANTLSDVSDIMQFWIPEHSEFNILSRDLGEVPSF